MQLDGVFREVNARDEQGGNNWRVNQLLYADDTVLLGDLKENIQRLLNEFNKVCERRKLVRVK